MSIELVITRLDSEPGAVRALADWITPAERQRANRFHFERDRNRFIVARARLRELLAARLGTEPSKVELEYGPHGKPRTADLHFNLSHCGDLAVFAFSRTGEVGVDVEAVRRVGEADAIAERMFSRRENEAYARLAPQDKPLGFFNCWTRKEAFVKALGDGLTLPLDRFDVTLVPGDPAKLLRVGNTPGERSGWRLDSFSPAAGYVAAVVTAH